MIGGTAKAGLDLGRKIKAGLCEAGRDALWGAPSWFMRSHRYPKRLFIFLTTRCNLRCFICRRENFTGSDMNPAMLEKLAGPIRTAEIADLTGWGEAAIHPGFERAVKRILDLNQNERPIQLTTNGTRLKPDTADLLAGRLARLVISLNAARAATYERFTQNMRFEPLLSRLELFLNGLPDQDRSRVILHFVAHAGNFRELPEFVDLAASLGAPAVSVGQYLINIPEHIEYSLLTVKQEYNQALDLAEARAGELGLSISARRFFLKEELPPFHNCAAPFEECYVLPDGLVSPCCFSGPHYMGNVFESGFDQVWFGPAYKRLRKSRSLPVCRGCAPFTPFDDLRAHFTAFYKEKKEFKDQVMKLERIKGASGGRGPKAKAASGGRGE